MYGKLNFAGENLREWLANLSHNVTDKAVNPVGLMIREKKKDIPETGGSIDYVPNKPGGRSESDQYNEYLDGKIKELGELDSDRWKKKEEEEEEPSVPDDPVDPTDPVDPDPGEEKTAGRIWSEKAYADALAEGMTLETAMKFNPATTPEDWARAFGECRTEKDGIPMDCYWPEDTDSGDYYSVGTGGGTANAKRGQAASRAKAAAARNMSAREGRRKATRSQNKPGK